MNPEIIETLKLLVAAIALVICLIATVGTIVIAKRNVELKNKLHDEKKCCVSLINQKKELLKEIEGYKFITKANEDVNRELQLRAEKLDLELRQTKARLDHKKIPTT